MTNRNPRLAGVLASSRFQDPRPGRCQSQGGVFEPRCPTSSLIPLVRSATGDPDAQLPCRSSGPRIRRLTVGRCAPADVCSVSVSPHVSWGARLAGLLERWPRLRGVSCCFPLPSPMGIRGRRARRVRRLRVRSRRSLDGTADRPLHHASSPTMPGLYGSMFRTGDRLLRCRRRSWPPPGSLNRLPIHRKWSQPSSAASRPTASLVAKDIRQTRVQIIGLSVEHPAPIQAQRPRSIAYVEEGRASAF